ncbi:histidine kinase [Streptomyces sp. NPDC003032]
MSRSRYAGDGDAREPLRTDGAEPPWSRNDALVTGGACALNLLSYVFFNDPDGRHVVSVPGFLLVALAAMPLLARREHPVAALAAVLALDATAALTVPLPRHFGAVLVVALYSVARACPGRVTAAAAFATVSLTLLSQSGGRIPPWQDALASPLTTLIVVGTALAVNRWQREVAANRELLADRAVADERRRIARELHDIVAHHITTMQLMAGGARANLAQPEVVRDALVTPGVLRAARPARDAPAPRRAAGRRRTGGRAVAAPARRRGSRPPGGRVTPRRTADGVRRPRTAAPTAADRRPHGVQDRPGGAHQHP